MLVPLRSSVAHVELRGVCGICRATLQVSASEPFDLFV